MSMIHSEHQVVTITAAVVALTLVACGHETQTQAAAAPSNAQPGVTSMQPTPSNTPTASSVAISDEVLRACNIPDGDAYFAFDSAHLTGFDQAPLDAVAVCFTSGPMQGHKLDLVGHAGPRGAMDYNMTLGQARSDAVAAYLGDHGLNRSQVSTSSRGAMDATGRDETGWAHDRRVDISLAK